MATLSDKADKPALPLDSHEDILDDTDESVKRWNHRFAMQRLGTVESYLQGKTELVLRIAFSAKQFDLVLNVVPVGVLGRLNTPVGSDVDEMISHTDGHDNSVAVPITHFVECPEQCVPVAVRLTVSKNRLNLLRKRPTAPQSELSGGGLEGKMVVSRLCDSSGQRYGVADVIECGPEIHDSVTCDQGQRDGDCMSESRLVDFVSRLRICFDDYFVRVFVEKRSDLTVQIADVMLCPLDLEP